MFVQIKSLTPLLNKYQLFLVDIAGVLHNGIMAYPGAIEALKALQQDGRKPILFSNAPRPGALTLKKLEGMGFDCTNIDILTSGDHFIDNIKQHQGRPTYILGADKNIDYNWRQYLNIVDDINQAEFILLLEYADSLTEASMHDQLLDIALKKGIEALCPNPDMLVHNGATLRYPAGYFAFQYQQAGGKVHYYGKPYRSFYEKAVTMHPCDKDKILAIGDNIDTDILGAHDFGIDSLLILGGIYRDHNPEEIEVSLKNSLMLTPTYVTTTFCL